MYIDVVHARDCQDPEHQGPELLVVCRVGSQRRQVYVNAQTHGTNRIAVVAWQLATVSV